MKKRAGFTLIEVLLAVAFLALGTVLIQEGFLRCAKLYGRYSSTMRASVWADERLWQAREAALFSDKMPSADSGEFEDEGQKFGWSLSVGEVPSARDLYSLKLVVEWSEGGNPVALVREIYAAKNPVAA